MATPTIGSILQDTIGPFLDALNGMSSTFVDTGMTFMALAITLTALSSIYVWWVSGSFQDLLENSVRSIIIIAPLLIIMNNWSSSVNSLSGFFLNEVPASLGVPGGSPVAVVGDAVTNLIKTVDAVRSATAGENIPEKNWDDALPPGLNYFQFWWEYMKHKASQVSNVGENISALMQGFTTWLYGFVMFVIICILTVILLASMMFAVFMPVASMYIGAIFGPLIIPWMLWKPLANMTERWVGFMIANGIAFCVALVLVNALKTSMSAMTEKVITASKFGETGDGIAAFVMTLVGIFAIYLLVINLMSQANNIAQGMTGGAAIGEGLFGKIAMFAGGAAVGKVAKATGGGAAGAASDSAKLAGAGYKAAASGLEKGGKAMQAAGLASSINGSLSATSSKFLTKTGNLMRSSSSAMNAGAQLANKGANVAQKGISKGANIASKSSTLKGLTTPFKKKDKK